MLSIFFLLLSILLAVLNPVGHKPLRMPPHTQDFLASKARVLKSYGALPLSFELNQGQADGSVRFLARGQGYTILLKPSEAVLRLQSPGQGARFPEMAKGQPMPSTRVLRMRIEGADLSAPATGLHRLPGVSNYFIGNDPSHWHTDIPTYKEVQFEHIRPGVNLVYYGNQSQLEYDFVLSPGVKPQSLGLSFEGSDAAIDPQGDLVFTSTDGQVTFRRPVAYQGYKSNPAKKHFLTASYVLKGHNRVGFEVPDYDPHAPLVIDPYLYYSTYLGGNGGDTGNAIALDSLNDAYITGSTSSTNFPTGGTPTPYQKTYGGDTDAFVTKLRYDGEAIIYSTYLGGNNYDVGNGIALDSSDDAYIVGSTSSANFPTTANVFQPTLGGNTNAFVAKLDPSGSKLLYSSFLGGSYIDYGLAIAVDLYGNAFVTGSTQSTDFPTVNPIQSGYSGNGDAFVAEIDPNLVQDQQLVYSTYLGGSSADSGQGIAVDVGDNAYVVGFTFSTNFPTYYPYQAANAGSVDAFITKISAYGTSLVFSTYLGGSGDDRAWAVALDSQYNIYVTGSTLTACTPAPPPPVTTYCAPVTTFPTTPDAFQNSAIKQSPGYSDVFVSVLNFPGTALLYSTLLGGSLSDSGAGIAVDSSGNAYVTGSTESSDFPTANAVQASYSGGTCGMNPCQDAFVTEVNSHGSSLVYSTYLGGSSGNYGSAIALGTNPSNSSDVEAAVVGTTFSPNFPAIAFAYQGQSGNTTGLGNVFISMVSHNNLPGVALTPQKIAFGNVTEYTTANVTSENVPSTVTLMNAGTVPLQVTSVAAGGDFVASDNCVGTIPADGGICVITVTYTPTVLANETQVLSIYDNATNNPQLVSLTGTGVTGATTVLFNPTSLVFGSYVLNTTSPSQTVIMTNNGQTPLTVTDISTHGDFAETTGCPYTPFTIAVNGSCAFQITFTPTNTGVRKGSLNITDNTAAGSSAITLTGTGEANYNLNSPTITQALTIGTTTTTFTISLSSTLSTFTDTIALSCASGTCSFNPANIALNSTTIPSISTLTVSGLSAPSITNPYIFTVNGADSTTGSATATLTLTIYFQDFSISASPAIQTVQSGATTIYTVTVSPVNGFGQPVALSCLSPLPQGVSCIANPAALTPLNGGAVSSQLSVSTTPQSTSTSGLVPRARPRIPPPPPVMLALWGISSLLMLVVLLVRRNMRFRGTGRRRRLIYAQVALATLALATAFWVVGCDTSIYTNVIQPSTVNGTPTGNYRITILGTYTGTTAGVNVTSGTMTTVTHQTTVNLTVQ
jgi:hypothetical protein